MALTKPSQVIMPFATYIQVLFDYPPLDVVGDRCVSQVVGDEVNGLPRVEVNSALSVHCLVVHLGRLRGRVLLDFTVGTKGMRV